MSLGVVVFGAGIAGKVRIRDVGAKSSDSEDPYWKLVGFVSRRKIEIEGVEQLEEEQVFDSPDVKAVIVCTENVSHEPTIRKALSAGKHVLVEFPAVTSASAAKELYEMAQEKGVILHEENISLLTDSFKALKTLLQNAGSPVVKAEVNFSACYNGWIENVEKSGGPFCASISLLHNMYELLGSDLKVTAGNIETTETEFTATANLSCAKCSDITIMVRRTKDRSPRAKDTKLTLADGKVIEDSLRKPATVGTSDSAPQKPGVFMQDFLQFVEEVKSGSQKEQDRQRSIRCLELADQLHTLMGLKQ